jgi:glycosyltransferase involved in cell wall biosynthesis
MDIAIFGPDPAARGREGGVASHMRYLAAAFAQLSRPPAMYFSDWRLLNRSWIPESIQRGASTTRSALQFLVRRHADQSVAHVNVTFSVRGGVRILPVILSCVLSRTPIMMQVHGGRIGLLRENRFGWQLWRWILRRVTILAIFPGPQWQEFAECGYAKKMRPARNMVRRTDGPISAGPHPRFLYLGRLVRSKGPQRVLESFSQLQQSGHDAAMLTIIGDGPLHSELQRQIASSPFAAKIRMTGFLQGRALRVEMEKCNIFVLPSDMEGFPLSFLEAAEMGMAGVVTTDSAVPLCFEEGKHFLGVDVTQPMHLLEQMRRLSQDSGLRRSIGVHARQRVHEEFTTETAGLSYLALYQEAIHVARPA